MPAAYKGKGKGRDARQSRSRNTTPSSASAPPIPSLPIQSYLENDVTKHIDQASLQYSDVLDLVSAQNIPDSKTLETLVEHLKVLSDMADNRGEVCNAGMREMSQKRKEVEDQELEREVQNRSKLKRETEEEDDIHKGGKLKKRKERASAKEERPLNHGAHELARQDGAETKVEGGKRSNSALSSHSLFLPTQPISTLLIFFHILHCSTFINHPQRLLQHRKYPRMRCRMRALRFHLHR